MIDVMMIVPTLDIAGAEKLVTDLSIRLSQGDCTVEVLTFFAHRDTAFENMLKEHNIKLTTMNKQAGIDISLLFRLKKYIVSRNPHIIHAHLNTLFYMMLLPRRYKKRVVFTVHTLAHKEATGLHMYARRHFFKKSQFVAISDLVNSSIGDYYGTPGITINNAIDTSLFVCNRNYDSCTTILSVGRLTALKNHALLIGAFAIVHNKLPHLKLNIYGEGELRPALTAQIDNLNLSDCCFLQGLTDNVPSALASGDIFVLPSVYEGFGLVVAEAMASGLPVISTINGGAENIINNGIDGFLITQTTSHLADTLYLLATDSDLRRQIGTNALVRSSAFDLDGMVQAYRELYDTVLSRTAK